MRLSNMRQITNFVLRIFFHDRLFLISFGAGLLVNIILWAILFGKFQFSHEAIPLHFNPVYGIDLVGRSTLVYELPATGFVILLVNLFLGRWIYPSNIFFSYLLTMAAASIQILLLVAVLALTAING